MLLFLWSVPSLFSDRCWPFAPSRTGPPCPLRSWNWCAEVGGLVWLSSRLRPGLVLLLSNPDLLLCIPDNEFVLLPFWPQNRANMSRFCGEMRSWEWILRYHGHDDLTAKIPCPGITTWKWLQRLGRATTLTVTSAGFHQWSVHNWRCLQFRIIIYYYIIQTITVWYCPYHGFHQLVPA